MALEYNGSPDPTIGVEIELQLIDRETHELAQVASKVLEQFPGSTWAKPELLQSTIEINTDVCSTIEQVRSDLEAKLDKVRAVCEPLGIALVGAGTHPFSRWDDQLITPDKRYHRLIQRVQWPARRLLIFGLHVHVGIPDGETAIAVTNHLEPWLPHLLALTASSPFWEGKDTGLASSRIKVFESLPTAGLPHRHGSWAEFEHLVDVMVKAQAIESMQEIWWDIRPHHRFGTVEVRVCDVVPTLCETVALTALIQGLIVYLQRQIKAGVELPLLHPRIVQENKWRAARYSTRGSTIVDEEGRVEPISETIERLVEDLEPIFQELGSFGELPRILQMVREGPSYARQRAIYKETGDFSKVVECLIRELEEDRPFHL